MEICLKFQSSMRYIVQPRIAIESLLLKLSYLDKSIDINDWSKDRNVYGIAGIGNPSSFFSLLRSLDFQVIEKVFPDHHEFIDTDFFEMNDLPIVMTEKDAIKCKFLKNPNCWYLKIEPVINEDFKTDLFKKII